MDQGEGNFVSASGLGGGGALDFGESQLENGRAGGADGLVFLPVLLLCVLRHRKVRGRAIQVFRLGVVCAVFVAKPAETLKISRKSLVWRHPLCSVLSRMRPKSPWKVSLLKPVLAGLLAVIFLGMILFGASERLHAQFHGEDTEPGHGPCVICALVNGQVDAPLVPVSEVFASLSVVWTVSFPVAPVMESVDLGTAPNRGPPVFAASLS